MPSGVRGIAVLALEAPAAGATTGFVPGTVGTAAPVTLGTWTGSGVRSGTQQLYFRNLWTHATGVYTTTLVYTLSAP